MENTRKQIRLSRFGHILYTIFLLIGISFLALVLFVYINVFEPDKIVVILGMSPLWIIGLVCFQTGLFGLLQTIYITESNLIYARFPIIYTFTIEQLNASFSQKSNTRFMKYLRLQKDKRNIDIAVSFFGKKIFEQEISTL